MKGKKIALEARLRKLPNVITLGVKTSFSSYTPEEALMIGNAKKIYYPSTFYADLFDAAGKETFPSYHTYKCVQDKIKQTALFQLLGLPHPKTFVFYGKKKPFQVTDHLEFPFIGKTARGSAMGKGVFLIRNQSDLERYCRQNSPAYFQEFLPTDRDLRVVVIGKRVVHAYWRLNPPGDFRSNISVGGKVLLKNIPREATEMALSAANLCKWDDVGMDVTLYRGKMYILEANMKYGKEGFRAAGLDYLKLMEDMIENGEI